MPDSELFPSTQTRLTEFGNLKIAIDFFDPASVLVLATCENSGPETIPKNGDAESVDKVGGDPQRARWPPIASGTE